jgi:hypothetical protein
MNGSTVAVVYDGDGNRVAKTVNGVTTRFLVDDLNQTGYPQVVEESVNGAVQRQYTYGLQRIDENQAVSNNWTSSFYGYDGFGTVRQLTNASGAVIDTYDYDALGNKINSTGTTSNNFLYRGEQYDSDFGVYYLRARYYIRRMTMPGTTGSGKSVLRGKDVISRLSQLNWCLRLTGFGLAVYSTMWNGVNRRYDLAAGVTPRHRLQALQRCPLPRDCPEA